MTDEGYEEVTPSFVIHESSNVNFQNNASYLYEPSTERPYKCVFPQCTFWCDQYKMIKMHLFTHSAEPYRCAYCPFTSADDNELRLHMFDEHQDQLSYQCSDCDCKFTSKTKYKKHLQLHIGKKRKKLPCPTCKRKY